MAKVIVYHSGYGCDTGCCGHAIEIENDDGTEHWSFSFEHPDLWQIANYPAAVEAKKKRFAQELVLEEFGEEHVADLVWDECIIEED